MNKISIYLQGIGGIIVLSSIIRWFFMWYDPSQAILGIAIGVIILGFGEIYRMLRNIFNDIYKLQKRADAMSRWYAKEEFK